MRRSYHHHLGSWSGLLALLGLIGGAGQAQAAVNAPIVGEIQAISVADPADHWSRGIIVVGGQNIIIPRNLLIDLPANRVTLQQLFAEAPPECLAAGETGLAKADSCNTSATGGFATIAANRTSAGNIIAGDVFIEKGTEAVTGVVTYIDYTDGYFRLNGDPGNLANTGVMVRLNDPTGRHTVQQGLGCIDDPVAHPNCSADPRFTLDPDNYTNVFSTGFPFCIPSTVSRSFTDVLGLGVTTAQANADGSGDVLCPQTNRTISNGQPVDDSRRFAPIMLGDSVTAEGSFEYINGVRFLSAHSSGVARALTTKDLPTQPDYLFLDEVEMDVPGFQNERARTLIIGYATRVANVAGGTAADVVLWTVHYDPQTNSPHEFPLASVVGCDLADGAGSCGAQGLVGAGANIFKIRHDVDFLAGAKPRLNPCAHLIADPRFTPLGICNNNSADTNIVGMFGILSPIPHEIIARTGQKLANPGLVTIDVNGNEATNGEYLFPFGMGLGGLAVPEMVEINLDALGTPFIFEGIPWNLDRRLSPNGCDGPCEATPQPLDPFPYSGLDPRTQAALPLGAYNNPNYTASALTQVRDRILSFVDPNATRPASALFDTSGNFDGNNTLLSLASVSDPPFETIDPTADVVLSCTGGGGGGGAIDTLTVDTAIFRTDLNRWRVSGTSTVVGPGDTVTVHMGPDLTGPVIRTVAVDPLGNWIVQRNATPALTPDLTGPVTVSVESSAGGVVLAVPVRVR